jgi:hypothetical protein
MGPTNYKNKTEIVLLYYIAKLIFLRQNIQMQRASQMCYLICTYTWQRYFTIQQLKFTQLQMRNTQEVQRQSELLNPKELMLNCINSTCQILSWVHIKLTTNIFPYTIRIQKFIRTEKRHLNPHTNICFFLHYSARNRKQNLQNLSCLPKCMFIF